MTDRMMCPTNPFDHQPRTRIVFGIDAVDRVGELASELGARRVLLVTDAGISDAGHAQRAREKLHTVCRAPPRSPCSLVGAKSVARKKPGPRKVLGAR